MPKPVDPRLLREARASAGFLAASVVVGALTAAVVIVQAWLLSDAIARLRADGTMLASLAAVFVARAGLVWLQEVLAYRSAAAVKSTLRRRVLASAVRATAGTPDCSPSPGTGGGSDTSGATDREAVSTLLGPGLDALDDYFARYLPQLVLAMVVPSTILVVLLSTDPVSAGTVAVTLPLIPVFMVLIGLATQRFAARRFGALAILAHHFTDVVGGLTTLKIFGRAKAQARSVAEVSDAHRAESVRSMRLAFLSALVLELLASLSVALVAVGVGVRLVDGTLDLRTGLLVLILAPEAYLPLRLVGQHFHASADGLAAAEQALAYPAHPTSSPPSPPSPPSPSSVGSDESTARTEPGIRVRDLAVRGVSGLTVTVRPGELVALYGPSGAGKSSVLAVLLGMLEPRAGTAEVTGSAVWVPQRPYLFAGTVADNVRLGAPDASGEVVQRACADAGLTGPELTPDRVLGEGGAGLSSGERRRVAVARALVVPPERAGVLLLDEPTAGLDGATERRIARTTEALARSGRAVLLVTHRPGTRAVADRVVSL